MLTGEKLWSITSANKISSLEAIFGKGKVTIQRTENPDRTKTIKINLTVKNVNLTFIIKLNLYVDSWNIRTTQIENSIQE